MPRLRRIPKQRNREVTLDDIWSVQCCGGPPPDYWLTEDMCRDFYCTHRRLFDGPRRLRYGRLLCGHRAGERVWCWWKWEAAAPWNRDRDQAQHLHELGELEPWECEDISAAHDINDWCQQPFRRSWIYWEFQSPEPRDPAKLEAAQIVGIGNLTWRERKILDDPSKARDWTPHKCGCSYLLPAERELLGIRP